MKLHLFEFFLHSCTLSRFGISWKGQNFLYDLRGNIWQFSGEFLFYRERFRNWFQFKFSFSPNMPNWSERCQNAIKFKMCIMVDIWVQAHSPIKLQFLHFVYTFSDHSRCIFKARSPQPVTCRHFIMVLIFHLHVQWCSKVWMILYRCECMDFLLPLSNCTSFWMVWCHLFLFHNSTHYSLSNSNTYMLAHNHIHAFFLYHKNPTMCVFCVLLKLTGFAP